MTQLTRSFFAFCFAVVLVFSPILSALVVYAEPVEIDDVRKFRAFNPDGQKYHFVKNYIKALEYFQNVVDRRESLTVWFSERIPDSKALTKMRTYLNQNNLELRIARNLFKQELYAENGLMLKVIELLQTTANEQIALNDREKALYDELDQIVRSPALFVFQDTQIKVKFDQLSRERKVSLAQLLQASLLIQKILISEQSRIKSHQTLGIMDSERQKLLTDLHHAFGVQKAAQVESGQSVIEASVISIRNILTDRDIASLDG